MDGHDTYHKRAVLALRSWLARTILVAVVATVVILAYTWVGNAGPAREARERAYSVLRQEVAALPPYPGSAVVSETAYDNPPYDHNPAPTVTYSLSGTCAAAHAHYVEAAAASGWALDYRERSGGRGDELASRFHKTAEGYALTLEIDCFIDQAFSSGYTLAIETP